MIWRGLGLAVPSNAVTTFLERGAPSRAELGVTVQAVDWNGGAGLLVTDVQSGSPAETASLMLGDVLLTSFDELAEQLESGSELLHLRFLRGERSRTREVTVRLPVRRTVAA
jgi:S1-C subfamily serine protease